MTRRASLYKLFVRYVIAVAVSFDNCPKDVWFLSFRVHRQGRIYYLLAFVCLAYTLRWVVWKRQRCAYVVSTRLRYVVAFYWFCILIIYSVWRQFVDRLHFFICWTIHCPYNPGFSVAIGFLNLSYCSELIVCGWLAVQRPVGSSVIVNQAKSCPPFKGLRKQTKEWRSLPLSFSLSGW